MKKYIIFPSLFLLFVLNSCHKEIKAEKGGIDIISNVYFDASKGLNKMQTFHISRLNYQNDSLIELVSDKEFPEIITDTYFIKDTVYYNLNNNTSLVFSEIQKQQKPTSVYAKTVGAVFTKATLLNYRNRRKLNDTILFKKNTNVLKSIRLGIIPDITFIQLIPFCPIQYTKKLVKIIMVELKG